MAKVQDEQFSAEEAALRYRATLSRILSTPPQPKLTRDDALNPPKKRGRPAKPKD